MLQSIAIHHIPNEAKSAADTSKNTTDDAPTREYSLYRNRLWTSTPVDGLRRGSGLAGRRTSSLDAPTNSDDQEDDDDMSSASYESYDEDIEEAITSSDEDLHWLQRLFNNPHAYPDMELFIVAPRYAGASNINQRRHSSSFSVLVHRAIVCTRCPPLAELLKLQAGPPADRLARRTSKFVRAEDDESPLDATSDKQQEQQQEQQQQSNSPLKIDSSKPTAALDANGNTTPNNPSETKSETKSDTKSDTQSAATSTTTTSSSTGIGPSTNNKNTKKNGTTNNEKKKSEPKEETAAKKKESTETANSASSVASRKTSDDPNAPPLDWSRITKLTLLDEAPEAALGVLRWLYGGDVGVASGEAALSLLLCARRLGVHELARLAASLLMAALDGDRVDVVASALVPLLRRFASGAGDDKGVVGEGEGYVLVVVVLFKRFCRSLIFLLLPFRQSCIHRSRSSCTDKIRLEQMEISAKVYLLICFHCHLKNFKNNY